MLGGATLWSTGSTARAQRITRGLYSGNQPPDSTVLCEALQSPWNPTSGLGMFDHVPPRLKVSTHGAGKVSRRLGANPAAVPLSNDEGARGSERQKRGKGAFISLVRVR